MADDALDQSRSETGPSLERQVKDLQAILGHLLASISETGGKADANTAKIDRCMAAAASATARAELAMEKARQAQPALDLLQRVADEAGDADPPRHAQDKRKRDRHGMHVVHGAGTAAAMLAFARSPLARGTHRAVSMALMAALGGAATIAGPSLLMPSPSPAHSAVVPVRHHPRSRAPAGAVSFPSAPAAARHGARRHRARAAAAATASPAASPGASPSPSPLPTAPAPSPVPSPLPTVLPSPSPTVPTLCHGHGCKPGHDITQLLSGLLPR